MRTRPTPPRGGDPAACCARRCEAGWAAPLLVAGLLLGCGGGDGAVPVDSADHRPWIVIGVDGAEPRVVERLWSAGELPALRDLAERGTFARLATDYGSSPLIWTTIATGRRPREHGIVDFVVPGAAGDVPVSSRARRVPALWNMLSATGRRSAVLGWWASWPAEEIDGVVVSDRILMGLDDDVYPPSFAAEVAAAERPDPATSGPDGGPPPALGFDVEATAERRDRVMARLGRRLAGELRPDRSAPGYDLLLVYFRSLDIVSHLEWHGWQPTAEGSGALAAPGGGSAEPGGEVAAIYRTVDRAIGEIVAAAPPYANVMVISDHGFRPAREPELRLHLDLDAVLARLGYLEPSPDGGVDLAATRVYSHRAPAFRRIKPVRFSEAGREPGGPVLPRQRAAVRTALERDLGRVSWPGGEPVFRVRDARASERRQGADFTIVVRVAGAADHLLVDGRRFDGAVDHLDTLTGTHHRHTAGLVAAAGPDVRRGAALEGMGIHDVAPTLLHALGLPVGEDFAGRVWKDLFTPPLAGRPVATVTSWGSRDPGGDPAAASAADRELLEELGALGYLD